MGSDHHPNGLAHTNIHVRVMGKQKSVGREVALSNGFGFCSEEIRKEQYFVTGSQLVMLVDGYNRFSKG